MATSPGPDYGAPPRDTFTIPHTGHPGAGTRRRLPLACLCYYVGIGYIVCLPPLYMRGLGYKCPISTRLHILYKHITTTSPTVTYLVHYIQHNSNKLHLGEYTPPP